MKNKKMQRILAAALSAQLMVSCMGTAVFATGVGNTFDSDGLTYKILTDPVDNMPGTVQVGKGYTPVELNKTSLSIPGTVSDGSNTYTVTAIGKKAFSTVMDKCTVGSVTIPATVTTIDDEAFSGQSSLNVTFAEGSQLVSIGDNAFESTGLSSITLPASLEKIGEYAFSKCKTLSSITM